MRRVSSIDFGPVWVFATCFVALFLRFGYNVAAGDQDEMVPFLLRLLDPSLFQNDWFVQQQALQIGVRTYVVWLMYPLAALAGVGTAAFTLYVAGWLLVATGAYRTSMAIVSDRVATSIALLLSLGVLHKWTLGGNDLVYSMFVGEMIAWGFALHALRSWLAGRDRSAALLLAIATWFQMLVGLLLFGLLVLERIWHYAAHPRGRRLRSDAAAFGIFVLASLPASIPIAVQQYMSLGTDASAVFYILAPFRNPFHHMFFSFGVKSILRFCFLLILAAGCFAVLVRRRAIAHERRLERITAITLLLLVVTILFTEIWPILLVTKLQVYKLSVVLKFLMLVVIAGALSNAISQRIRSMGERFLIPGRPRHIVSTVAVLTVAAAALWRPAFVRDRLDHQQYLHSDLGRMESWIASNTHLDAVFAIPPSNSTFRSNAHRAVVANYQAFPFDDAGMLVWFERLLDVAPIEHPATGLGVKPVLDSAYYAQETDDWRSLGSQYGADYVLTDSSRRNGPLDFDVVHQEGDWRLYRIGTP